MQEGPILDRYEPIGTAGEGGFGTVQIAWDPRIQRRVAIKTIKLTAHDAYRAALPGAQAVAVPAPSAEASHSGTRDRWHGVTPWGEYLQQPQPDAPTSALQGHEADCGDEAAAQLEPDPDEVPPFDSEGARREQSSSAVSDAGPDAQVTSLAHLPGLDEARTAAMLSDARIVTVYDFEVRGRMAYLIMEYVEGITLTDLLADYSDYLTLDMVAAVFDSVAGALTEAHGAGVLHLDIKPDNILINSQGQVKVTDFGLATLADAAGMGTTGGGTIGYMPLEQMRREHLDARTDEWSLASVAYEMLTGDNPFRVPGLESAEAAIEQAELVLPSLCWGHLDAQADDVVFYALDPNREERYATVADFAEELDKFLGDAEHGREQLALVVADALGYDAEDDGADGLGVGATDEMPAANRRPGLLRRIAAFVAAPAAKADQGDAADDGGGTLPDSADRPVRAASSSDKPSDRQPLSQRLGGRAAAAAARLYAGVASAFVAYLALSNIPALAVGFGPGTSYVVAAGAVVAGLVGVLHVPAGALVAFCLLGIALIMCGHPIAGAVVLVVSVAWWYTEGHKGKAYANVALLGPLAGAVGASSAVPLLAGAALRPVAAVATTAFAFFLAVVMGAFGSMTPLGWDAFTYWDFASADITAQVVRMLSRPATWATAAGWLLSSLAVSLLNGRGSRVLAVLGTAAGVTLVLVGSLAFASPSPQLIVPVALAAAVLLALQL